MFPDYLSFSYDYAASLRKNYFTYPPSCILPSFSQNASPLLLQKRLWKCASTISFTKNKRKGVLLVIYLFKYDSSKSTFFMLLFNLSWVWFLSKKLEFFVSCKTKIARTSFFLLSLCGFWYVLFYYNLIVLHYANTTSLLWHLYQIHTFNNNLNDEEMITSHKSIWEKKTVIEKTFQNMLHVRCASSGGGPGGPDPCLISIQSKLCPQILKAI